MLSFIKLTQWSIRKSKGKTFTSSMNPIRFLCSRKSLGIILFMTCNNVSDAQDSVDICVQLLMSVREMEKMLCYIVSNLPSSAEQIHYYIRISITLAHPEATEQS